MSFDNDIKRLFVLHNLRESVNYDYKQLLAKLTPQLHNKVYNGVPFKYGTDFEFIKTKDDKIFLRKQK